MSWTVFSSAFLTAAVEWVEAYTIVLAVSLTIGWRAALGAVAAASATLVGLTAATGGVLALGAGISWIQLLIGVFLLLFGVRWLAKAIAREAGLTARHNEDEEFAATRAQLASADGRAAWLVAYKGVLLEGLEVWLIVIALGIGGAGIISSAGGAIAALLPVVLAGAYLRGPLRRVPENAIKFVVGAMIGMERSILSPLAEQEFHLVARTAVLSFIVVFGLSKAITKSSKLKVAGGLVVPPER